VVTQNGHVRQPTSVEALLEKGGELGLAAAFRGESQGVDGEPTGQLGRQGGQGSVEEAAIGIAGEELVAVDETNERHRLASQRVDDVAIVDDLAALAVALRAPSRQRHQVGAAEKEVEPIIVEPDPQAVADETRGHRVEHSAQNKAARRGDGDQRLLAISGPPIGQPLQGGALGVDALSATPRSRLRGDPGGLRALRRPTSSSRKRR